MSGVGRLGSRTALAVALLAIAAAAVVVLTGRHLSQLKAERDAASTSADAVAAVSDALRTEESGAALRPAGGGTTLAAAIAQGVSLPTLTVARDSGRPVLDDVARKIVVARYGGTTPPQTVQQRRDQVSGFRVAPFDLTSTLKSLRPDRGGIAVSGPNQQIQAIPSTGPGSAASSTAPLGSDLGAGWTVTVWTAPAGTPPTLWLLALVLLVAGLGAAGWVGVRQAESRIRRHQLSGLQRTSATVAEVATLAQHSLDLGEVLPAVTTELSAVLGLHGMSLSAPTAQGERPVFVLGVAPDPDVQPQDRDEVAPGETLAVVLSRGGRIVATLRVRAGRALDRDDVRTLVAAADVLTSALSNAELFAQQSVLIERMRTVDELKTVFLATASHELRTPVVALAGYANLLNSNWDLLPEDAARGYAERIDAIAQRLNTLVEDILDFSRLQSGKSSGATEAVLDLSELVGEVLDEQAELAPDHQVVYRPSPGLPISGSRQALERVVTNLVGNAAKYSEPGSTITVSTRRIDGHAELVVDDEGPGIPADQREQVFSPFYRGSGDEVVRTRGAGLGLAIVSEFAASMSGRARVEEASGGGASFVVSYPIVESDSALETGVAHVQP